MGSSDPDLAIKRDGLHCKDNRANSINSSCDAHHGASQWPRLEAISRQDTLDGKGGVLVSQL